MSRELDNMRRKGLILGTAVDANRLSSLINKLKPIKTQHELMRVGPGQEGGYLIPDDISGLTACFSASSSIDSSVAFELDLLESFGINSHIANYSMEEPPGYFKPLTFMPKFLGVTNNNSDITLDSWLKKTMLVTEYENYDQHLLLKLDINCNEYGTILSASDKVLKRFRIIVLKLNDVDQWAHPSFFGIAEHFTKKILQHFNVVHIHPDNSKTTVNVNGVDLPEKLEITLLAKRRCTGVGYVTSFPDELDKPCNPDMPEIVLSEQWYKS
jgi:hypothetical protein